MDSAFQRLGTYLRYDWPLHFFLWLTDALPDNVVFLKLRGWVATPFFGACGKNLRLGRHIDFYFPRNIQIGDNVYIAYGCVFLGDDSIVIEDEVIFGPYTVTASSNHTRFEGSFRYGITEFNPVRIKRGCWISSHAVLTAGSTVGAGSLVAAGAVVTGEIPPNVVVGGVPARIIKYLETDGNA